MSRAPHQQAVRRRRVAGGWLVTYADLMTILVCFFVLIVSFSIQDQVKMEVVAGSLRDAFGVAEQRRYAGDVRFEGAPDERHPGNVRPSSTPTGAGVTDTLAAAPAAGSEGDRGAHDHASSDRRIFEAAAARLEQAILMHPIAKDANDAVTINLTETGLQVLIVDTAGRPMFEAGGSAPTPEAQALLEETARALAPLANRIIVEAHADATASGRYSAFELTAARANAALAIMRAAGLPERRFAGSVGRGEAFPLYPEDPYAPGNRRIEIVLEPAAPLVPEDRSL